MSAVIRTTWRRSDAGNRLPLVAKRSSGKGLRRLTSRLWLLVALPVLAIPFENEYTFFGYSLGKLSIIPLAIAVVSLKPLKLLMAMKHPVFLGCVTFGIWASIAETLHPYSNWQFQLSFIQTVFFSALVGAVVTDALVFRRTLIAIAAVCTILAFYFVYNYYGLVSADVTGWRAGARLRSAAFDEMSLGTGLNVLAYIIGMGAIVSLARFVASSSTFSRFVWGSLSAVCTLGALMPLSRGAFIAVIGGSVVVVMRNLRALVKPGRLMLLAAAAAVIFTLMPSALSARLSSLRPGGSVENGRVEGRTKLFDAALEAIPEYWKVGVGVGNYWAGEWGRKNGFLGAGPHSGFLASWIFFGLPGLGLLSLICYLVLRSAPKVRDRSWEENALAGLLVLAFVWLMFTHNLYFKAFGLVLGLLIGSSNRALEVSADRLARARAAFVGRRLAFAHYQRRLKFDRRPSTCARTLGSRDVGAPQAQTWRNN